MTDVHKEIHKIKNMQVRDLSSTKPQPFDPIAPVAQLITDEAWLICFDEFQVTDIGNCELLKIREYKVELDSKLGKSHVIQSDSK